MAAIALFLPEQSESDFTATLKPVEVKHDRKYAHFVILGIKLNQIYSIVLESDEVNQDLVSVEDSYGKILNNILLHLICL